MPQTNETALEKTFSDLAYSHLRDKSQSLLDYLVGFQMLKQEDDGQRAVGIFGFEIDEDYYYAPVFFMNGEIRGLDSLYSVKSDLFVPLTDGWVSSIIDRRQVRLGDPDTRSRNERGIHVPNYTRMKVIPGGGGSVNLKLAEAMMGDREDEVESISLTEELSKIGAAGYFKQALDANPRLRDHFERFGYNYLDLADAAPQQKQAQEEAVVIINSVTDEGAKELTDEQKQDVLEGGTVVIDNRPEVSKSRLYRTETEECLENPTEGGLYDVLWKDGSVRLAVVTPSNTLTNCVFVYDPENSKYCEIDRTEVWCLRKYSRQELVDWLSENAGNPADVRPQDVVVFISESGESTAGFCIKENNKGVDGITTLRIHDRHCMTAGAPVEGLARGNNGNPPHNLFKDLWVGGNGGAASGVPNFGSRPRDPNCRVDSVIVAETGDAAPSYTKDYLIVNSKRFWALKINQFRMREVDETGDLSPYEVERYQEPRYDAILDCADFGNYNTIRQALDKVAEDLRAWRSGTEVTVKTAGTSANFRKEADGIRFMMRDLGLSEEDARTVIKEASPTISLYKYRPTTKEAAEMLTFPEVEDTDLGGFLTSFHQQAVPFQTVNQARSPQNREFYQYYSPFGAGGGDAEGEPNTFSAIETAGETGQKDVFDASALGSLIKNHTPTDLVDKFLPTITSGMDRIGRMLFLIYWHYEDFEERYGENDLAEFVDNLKAVFEQLGDIIVFSKKRSLAGDPEHFGMGAAPIMDEAG